MTRQKTKTEESVMSSTDEVEKEVEEGVSSEIREGKILNSADARNRGRSYGEVKGRRRRRRRRRRRNTDENVRSTRVRRRGRRKRR